MKEYKKQYKIEGKPKNQKQWLTVIFRFYNTLEEAKEAMELWKKLRNSKDSNWEYRILVRDVSEWKEL